MFEYQERKPDIQESGASLLHELEKTGEYVFHGSKTGDIKEMEIRPPSD